MRSPFLILPQYSRWTFLFLLILGCASHPAPSHVADQPVAECTLSDTTNCRPKPLPAPTSPNPSTVTETEAKPFFEASGASATSEAEELPTPESEEVIGQEVEEEIAKSAPPQFDIPIVVNAQVEKWIHYFQNRGRKYFAAWLSRSERYIPMMKRILRENGLPEDLVYLAMIESGFKPYAYSRAKASGPWQFIKGTGALYGLKVTWWIDERRDPEKSTIAAAQHLKDLYDQFNSWYLAAAGYNAGAGKISKAIRKYSTEDFWEMSKSKHRYLKAETKDYVPKMIAAALIAKEPEKYGFTNTEFDEPLQYDIVHIEDPVEITQVAEALGVSTDIMFELNPELKRDVTPPDIPNYELKIPKGSQGKFVMKYPDIREKSASVVVRHVVSRRESLASIAKRYRTTSSRLVSFNRLPGARVKRGMQLAIPMGRGVTEVESASAESTKSRGRTAKRKSEPSSTYRVRPGDTLWSISRSLDVTVAELKSWNKGLDPSNLKVGKRLKVEPREDHPVLQASSDSLPVAVVPQSEEWKTYVVRKGDTLSKIARTYGVSISQIAKWNEMETDDPLRPGDELKVKKARM